MNQPSKSDAKIVPRPAAGWAAKCPRGDSKLGTPDHARISRHAQKDVQVSAIAPQCGNASAVVQLSFLNWSQKMGLTKRRLMAIEEDLNRDLRLCAACGERVEYEDAGKSWQVELSLTGPFITVWLCEGCAETTQTDSCLRCHGAPRADAPICDNCLSGYISEIDKEAENAECSRCGSSIPMGEWDIYYESDMCELVASTCPIRKNALRSLTTNANGTLRSNSSERTS